MNSVPEFKLDCFTRVALRKVLQSEDALDSAKLDCEEQMALCSLLTDLIKYKEEHS